MDALLDRTLRMRSCEPSRLMRRRRCDFRPYGQGGIDCAAFWVPAEGVGTRKVPNLPHLQRSFRSRYPQEQLIGVNGAHIKDPLVETAIRVQTAKPSRAVVAHRRRVRAICRNSFP